MPRDSNDTLAALVAELARARRRSDFIFEQVPQTLFFARPIPERHRIAFYLGHLEAFDLNLLLRATHDSQAPHLDRLFAFGIDPVGGALPTDSAEEWPRLDEIKAYATATRSRLDRWLSDSPAMQVDGVSLITLLDAAVEHRLMHVETLAYMLNHLPTSKPLRAIAPAVRDFDDDDMASIPAGTATLGMRTEGAVFGWDNEHPSHSVEVSEFEIDRYMVTNAQFARFIETDAYGDARWWQAADSEWLNAKRIRHPASWRRVNDAWQLLSFADAIPLQNDWPVYVSQAEASAYAKWAGKELPTEAQWHRAAYGAPSELERRYPWGESAPAKHLGNFNFDRWDPMSVDAHPAGASAFGVVGLLGNGWEWTRTPFAPFAGFKPFSFYRGYSADFFDGRHFVLKGGSAHTAERLLRRSFRNWFQPHYPYPFAGFRCVKNR